MTLLILWSLLFCGGIVCIVYAKQMHKKIQRRKKELRIPEGTISYSDLNVPGKALFSKKLQLTGKPDYIVQLKQRYIPIELKSSTSPTPQKHHILQLAAYCQLLEDQYQEFVPYGLLVYQNTDFTIPFNPKLRFELATILKEMRWSMHSPSVTLNHSNPHKCLFCSMKHHCAIKLA